MLYTTMFIWNIFWYVECLTKYKENIFSFGTVW
jgi:hypothetical protein